MRTRAAMVASLSSIVLLVAGCGDDESSSSVDLGDKTFDVQTSTAEVEVDAVDNSFDPAYVEVSRGTTITFTNDGRNQHNVLPADDGAFEPIEVDMFEPGASRSIRFDETGDYPYYCSLHGTKTKGMVGGIRVVE